MAVPEFNCPSRTIGTLLRCGGRLGPRAGQVGNEHFRSRMLSVLANSVEQAGFPALSRRTGTSFRVSVSVSICWTLNVAEPKMVAVALPLSLFGLQLV